MEKAKYFKNSSKLIVSTLTVINLIGCGSPGGTTGQSESTGASNTGTTASTTSGFCKKVLGLFFIVVLVGLFLSFGFLSCFLHCKP